MTNPTNEKEYQEVADIVGVIEEMIDKKFPGKEYLSEVKNSYYNYRQIAIHDIELVTRSILSLTPKLDLLCLVKYGQISNSCIPAIIIDIWLDNYYRTDISLMWDKQILKDISRESSVISLVNNFNNKVTVACDCQLDIIKALEIQEINNPNEIENILSKSAEHCGHYLTGLKKLIPYYKELIDNMDSKDIMPFINNLNYKIELDHTDLGDELIEYAVEIKQKIRKLEVRKVIKTSDSIEELIVARRDSYDFGYNILVWRYDNKIKRIINQKINSNKAEDYATLYNQCSEKQKRPILEKWLFSTNEDSLDNIHIFKRAKYVLEKGDGIVYESESRIIETFDSKLHFKDFYELLLQTRNDPSNEYYLENIDQIEEIVNIAIRHIYTILACDLVENLNVVSLMNNNKSIGKEYNRRFFEFGPSIDEIENYGNTLNVYCSKNKDMIDDFCSIIDRKVENALSLKTSPDEMSDIYALAKVNSRSDNSILAVMTKEYKMNKME